MSSSVTCDLGNGRVDVWGVESPVKLPARHLRNLTLEWLPCNSSELFSVILYHLSRLSILLHLLLESHSFRLMHY